MYSNFRICVDVNIWMAGSVMCVRLWKCEGAKRMAEITISKWKWERIPTTNFMWYQSDVSIRQDGMCI